MAHIWDYLGIAPWAAVATVLGTSVLFLVFSAIISWLGQSLRARISIFSVAFMTLIGAIAARSMLGNNPTMTGGLIVLATLMFWEAILTKARGLDFEHSPRARRAKAVVVAGQVNPAMLARARVTERELLVRLRQAGITDRSQVALAIIETDGALTLLRAGQPIERALLVGVLGLEDAPETLFAEAR
jgi:uncharacterized membrane protein YcaP (DUF421 family)